MLRSILLPDGTDNFAVDSSVTHLLGNGEGDCAHRLTPM